MGVLNLILIAQSVLCHAGVWRTFTGNEIGILLAHWMWCCWRRDHLDDDPACVVMLASAVSSKMLQAMAQVHLNLHGSAAPEPAPEPAFVACAPTWLNPLLLLCISCL